MDSGACDVVSNKASADASFSGECLCRAIADSCPESHIVAPVINVTTSPNSSPFYDKQFHVYLNFSSII